MVSTGENVRSGDTHTPPTLDAGESVLLLAPAMDTRGDECCTALSCPGNAADVDHLAVSLDDGVESVIDRWNHGVGETPGRTAVITVGDGIRSAAAASGGDSPSVLASNISTTNVSDVGDLTGLGIKVSQCLSAWEEDDNDLTVCFQSLTTLLQFADVKRVFQFLHVLTQRISGADASAHFHMDPNAHDQQTLATLRSLFDAVYELDADGSWRRY